MKKYAFFIILIVMVLGFFTGFYLYKINRIKINKDNFKKGELVKNEITTNMYNTNIISTNKNNQKISPNCKITLKIYYKECAHLVESKKSIQENEVNLTEEEIKTKFPEWELQKFSPLEIVLYKEVNGFCNEHYVLKEKDGRVTVFKLDENNNEELEEKTNISTNYLEEEDLEKLHAGIYINSKKELNKALEDFE